jgi:hypothetical protein
MRRHLERGALEQTLELMHARGDVERLYDEMDRHELLREREGGRRNA